MLKRKITVRIIAVALSSTIALALAELFFRVLEHVEAQGNKSVGAHWINDPELGWVHQSGPYHHKTAEFDATGTVNAQHMNDRPENGQDFADKVRILALGDSHTFATGVSTQETWPKQLEASLNAHPIPASYQVFNAGTTGYSMHQYILRNRRELPRIKPHYVVLGLSYATDFYDLLPPERGGWIYGGNKERSYFDLEDGDLIQRHFALNIAETNSKQSVASAAREFLGKSAMFRKLRRSRLMLALGGRLKIGGQSLWPNMEIVMERDISTEHQYNHQLFRALLTQLKQEVEAGGAKLIVLGIPYLPQVYEDIRESTFPGIKYDPDATTMRVQALCSELSIAFADTTSNMRAKSKALGKWLHFRDDAHPTAEGHKVIAETVTPLILQ